jgi:hypothetical protein
VTALSRSGTPGHEPLNLVEQRQIVRSGSDEQVETGDKQSDGRFGPRKLTWVGEDQACVVVAAREHVMVERHEVFDVLGQYATAILPCPLQYVHIGELRTGEARLDGVDNIMPEAAARLSGYFGAVQLVEQDADYTGLRWRSQASRCS